MKHAIIAIIVILLLSACAAQPTPTPTLAPTSTPVPPTATPEPTPTISRVEPLLEAYFTGQEIDVSPLSGRVGSILNPSFDFNPSLHCALTCPAFSG